MVFQTTMCGFAGFVLPARPVPWNTQAVLNSMVASLAHRGPDDSGTWISEDAGVFMGFRRLSILDLSTAGHQPMLSPTGRYVVTFNGEIYNFESLRDDLRGEGVTFRSRSDTEVLLASCERWGVQGALQRFRGMFSFALFDTRERRLWLARDRLGIKPLFLLKCPHAIAFASEARAFHSCPLLEGRGNPVAAWHFLKQLCVPTPLSILEGVEKVRPGEVIRFRVGGRVPVEEARERYWDLKEVASVPPDLAEEEVVEALYEVLRESVRLRLIADVPVGALLSGGLDSSVVVALMQELSSEAVRTFTIAFDDPDFDEGPIASEVARYLGAKHTSVAFSKSEVLDLLPTLPGLSDEPMANPSLLPTLLISRVARRDVVVALSGDGGDELFGGYNRYRHGANLIRRAGRLPRIVRKGLGRIARSASTAWLAELASRAAPQALAGGQQSVRERLLKVARVLTAETDQDAYESLLDVGTAHPPVLGPEPSSVPWEGILALTSGPLESRMMLLDQSKYLPDDLLTKIDRASMWESLEARVPMLDHHVVELSWRIPLELKIRNGQAKWPLRQIASRYLPSPILDRPKMGFTVPIDQWMASELRDWSRDTLSPARLRDVGIWEPSRIEAMWQAFERGERHLALPLWTVSVLQAWSDAWRVRFG